MAITGIDFVDVDLTTVLFDLDSPTGSENASWGSVVTKFALGGRMTVTAPHDAERFEQPGLDGAITTFTRRGLGNARWVSVINGSSEANLRLGIGRATDLVTRGTILRITTSTTTRYLAIEPSAYPQVYSDKELEFFDIYTFLGMQHGLGFDVMCQPYWFGAETTIGPTDVPNDPASTNGRALSVSIAGDLPTPVRVRARMEGVDRTLQTSAAADDIIDCTGHGFNTGQAVIFTSLTGGAGLTAGTTYYVTATSLADNTFRIAATRGGADIGFTTDITAGTVIDAPNVARVLVAAHTTAGLRNAAAIADYQDASNGRVCQLEGNNGFYTITLASGVTAGTDPQSSPGGAGNTVASHTASATMAWKVRATATSVEHLRGDWDVWLRYWETGDSDDYEIELAWGPGITPPFPFVNPRAVPPTTDGNTSLYDQRRELNLGPISLPLTDTLTGIGFEVRTRSASSAVLKLDHLWFVSRDQQGTIVVPLGGVTTVLGKDLQTAVTNPAGGTAGTPSGNRLLLDTTTDNAGISPGTGIVFPAGQWSTTYRFSRTTGTPAAMTVDLVTRNITASTNAVSRTVTLAHLQSNPVFTVEWNADGTSAYQPQVDNPSATTARIDSISYEFTSGMTNDTGFRTDPARPGVDRINSSGAVTGYLASEGAVPLVLSPGTNIVSARALDVALPDQTDYDSRRQRQMALTLTYNPRYPL